MAWASGDSAELKTLKSMSLEDLTQVEVQTVISASGFEQDADLAPSSVSIVTAEEIKRYGYRTLADILRSLPGFYASNDRNYDYLGRGGVNLGDYNSRILVLVDGHRINNNLNDGAALGTDFVLDIDLIERIEVIRGPGSVIYGNNAFFGVINVITRRGVQVNGVEASGEYGSFDSYKARISAGKSFTNGVAVLFSGTFYQTAGPEDLFYKEFNTPAQNNGVAHYMNGDTVESAFCSVSYAELILRGSFLNREHTDPTAPIPLTFNDSRAQIGEQRSYADLEFKHELPAEVDLTAHFYYDNSQINSGYPQNPFYQDDQSGEWWGSQLQLTRRFWEKQILSIGAEYRDDFSQSDHLYNSTYSQTINGSRTSYGVFGESDFTLLSNLHLNSGLRYDECTGFDPQWSPRLALIYNPLPASTLKAIYGTAFRNPSFDEVNYNPNVLPEKIQSYELVYEQKMGQNLKSSVAGFYNRMNNLLLFQTGTYQNIDADSESVELALDGHWTNGVMSRISYTFQKLENRSNDLNFPDSPDQLFKFNLSVPILPEKIFAGLEYQYTSSSTTYYTTSDAVTHPGPDASGYGIFNATLFSRSLLKNLEVSASVYNLLGTSYSNPSSQGHLQSQIQQDGRSFRVKLAYKF